MEIDTDLYRFGPHPDMPGWSRWEIKAQDRFNAVLGDLAVRRDGDRALLRLFPQQRHANLGNKVHGGALLTFIDVGLFVAPLALGDARSPRGVTVELSTQFAGAADIDDPIDLIVEVTRETGRMIFLRGTVEQRDAMVASFMAIVRKAAS
ncbi:PaaI family thioesterase [Rhizorhabdus wittichii]|uniref:Thioesterase superfamily protein n=2 Tax=Rhizorhabdus wittichii TaxID=160791 RepID=A0A9J9LDE8_RHIWR|nr:PaaI family thioesterase [Rhizorhabdus wittichii]ABQ67668.1 thioesterase superfamily protein [Rhizorhabdus wittichii RW1]QTH21872.1 PaaI family thioesterase [Rhizorhabdus wittichii]